MPAPSFDIVEVTLKGELEGQEVNNVLFFEKTSGSITAEEIAQSAATNFITRMLPIVTTNYTFQEVLYRNLFDASEQGTIDVIDQTGALIEECMPPHDTVSYQILHDEPSIRNGRKALAGISEVSSSSGTLVPGAIASFTNNGFDWIVPALKDVATATVDVGKPVIVKRIAQVINGVTRYRLPTQATEAVVGFVYDIVLSSFIRTQNSRKVGRGS